MGERPPHPWFFLPRAARAAIRLTVVGFVVALGWAWRRWPATTPIVLAWATLLAAVVGAAWLGWMSMQSLLLWPHRRRNVNPTARTLAPILNYPAHTPARRILHIPLDYSSSGVESVLILPRDFLGEPRNKDQILGAFRTLVSVGTIEDIWYLGAGGTKRVVIRNDRKTLPTKVRYSPVIRELIDAAPFSKPLLLVDHHGKPQGWDMQDESPHGLLNAESGFGKTSLLRLMGAQSYRNGDLLAIVDPKWFSHGWAFHLDGVEYWRTPAQIHGGITQLVAELHRRNEVTADHIMLRKPIPRFRRLVLLFDEANLAARGQRNWWRQVRELGDPPTPPALSGLLDLLQAGRQVRMHVILVTQHGTAKALGDPSGEIREAFGTRMFGRSAPPAWRLLAPQITPIPPKSEIPGRMHLVVGSRRYEGQVPYLSDDEAEQLALQRRPGAEEPGLSPVTDMPATQGKHGGDSADVTASGDTPRPGHAEGGPAGPEAPEVVLVSLKEASIDRGDGLVPVRLATLKRARSRAKAGVGTFPAATATNGTSDNATEMFDLDELRARYGVAGNTGPSLDQHLNPDQPQAGPSNAKGTR